MLPTWHDVTRRRFGPISCVAAHDEAEAEQVPEGEKTCVAAGVVLVLHPRLRALPSLGLGYNFWYVTGAGGNRASYAKHALQFNLRADLASPITPRWSLVVTPYLQPNLVHGGDAPPDGPRVSLGLSAGAACWL